MLPPKQSKEALSQFAAKAIDARRERAKFKLDLANSERSFFDAINDPRESIQRLKVSEALESVPGIGSRRAFLIMEKCGISKTRRIGGLGQNQIKALKGELLLSKRDVTSGALIVMSGPGGVGKSTITKFLKSNASFWISISATTRNPRPDEVDGADYYFITDKKFDDMVSKNEFLEWAEFAGNRYGTPRSAVTEARNNGKHVLLEIEIAGARQIKRSESSALLVFIAPPSWDELVLRLTSRGTDSPERRATRLALAQEEMAASKEFDQILINERVEEVAQALLSLVSSMGRTQEN